MPRFLVVIPAYNEEGNIEEVVRGAQAHFDVCVVDDNSRDGTPRILASIEGVHVIRHERNTHIAGAILDGMRHALAAGYDYAITMDAGLSHDPDELPRFAQADSADLVIGTRLPGTERNKSVYRKALSRTGALLMNAILPPARGERPRRIRDCTSGYRRYSRRAMELLTNAPLRSRAFDFLLESLAVIARAGLTIREVPISYRFTGSSLDRRVVLEAFATWRRLRRDQRAADARTNTRFG
ncbi:MAG TPA: glycosyltransferase [Casimicrobiaceae bacterium]|nr:glycosyltransferase [Casimicrobiaceae bacterium]